MKIFKILLLVLCAGQIAFSQGELDPEQIREAPGRDYILLSTDTLNSSYPLNGIYVPTKLRDSLYIKADSLCHGIFGDGRPDPCVLLPSTGGPSDTLYYWVFSIDGVTFDTIVMAEGITILPGTFVSFAGNTDQFTINVEDMHDTCFHEIQQLTDSTAQLVDCNGTIRGSVTFSASDCYSLIATNGIASDTIFLVKCNGLRDTLIVHKDADIHLDSIGTINAGDSIPFFTTKLGVPYETLYAHIPADSINTDSQKLTYTFTGQFDTIGISNGNEIYLFDQDSQSFSIDTTTAEFTLSRDPTASPDLLVLPWKDSEANDYSANYTDSIRHEGFVGIFTRPEWPLDIRTGYDVSTFSGSIRLYGNTGGQFIRYEDSSSADQGYWRLGMISNSFLLQQKDPLISSGRIIMEVDSGALERSFRILGPVEGGGIQSVPYGKGNYQDSVTYLAGFYTDGRVRELSFSSLSDSVSIKRKPYHIAYFREDSLISDTTAWGYLFLKNDLTPWIYFNDTLGSVAVGKNATADNYYNTALGFEAFIAAPDSMPETVSNSQIDTANNVITGLSTLITHLTGTLGYSVGDAVTFNVELSSGEMPFVDTAQGTYWAEGKHVLQIASGSTLALLYGVEFDSAATGQYILTASDHLIHSTALGDSSRVDKDYQAAIGSDSLYEVKFGFNHRIRVDTPYLQDNLMAWDTLAQQFLPKSFGAITGDADWFVWGTIDVPTDIDQNIFTNGQAYVGDGGVLNTQYQFQIIGDTNSYVFRTYADQDGYSEWVHTVADEVGNDVDWSQSAQSNTSRRDWRLVYNESSPSTAGVYFAAVEGYNSILNPALAVESDGDIGFGQYLEDRDDAQPRDEILNFLYTTNDGGAAGSGTWGTLKAASFDTLTAIVLDHLGPGVFADSLGIDIPNERVVIATGTKAPQSFSGLEYASSFSQFRVPFSLRAGPATVGTIGNAYLTPSTLLLGYDRTAPGTSEITFYNNAGISPDASIVSDGSDGSLTIGAFGYVDIEQSGYTGIQVYGTGSVRMENLDSDISADTIIGIDLTGKLFKTPLITYDGSETKINAGTDISVSGSGTVGSPYIITNTQVEKFINSASFTGGNLTMPYNTSGQVTVSLDGRYALIGSVDNYVAFRAKVNTVGSYMSITSQDTLVLVASTGISISQNNALDQFTFTNLYDWGFGVDGAFTNIADNKSVNLTQGGGIDFSAGVVSGDVTLSISHENTSSVVNTSNGGNFYIKNLTFDSYGHVTGVTSGEVSAGGGGGIYTGSGNVGGGTLDVTASVASGRFFLLDYNSGSGEIGISPNYVFLNHSQGVLLGDSDRPTDEILIDAFTGGARIRHEGTDNDSRIDMYATGLIAMVAQYDGPGGSTPNASDLYFAADDRIDIDAGNVLDMTGGNGITMGSGGYTTVNDDMLIGKNSDALLEVESVSGSTRYVQIGHSGNIGATDYAYIRFYDQTSLVAGPRQIVMNNVGGPIRMQGDPVTNVTSGTLYVGATWGSLSSPGFSLWVQGTQHSSTSATFDYTSDSTIKRQIQEINEPYEVINQLRPVTYRYKKSYLESSEFIKDKVKKGFIAQDYEKIFPEDVTRGTDGLLSMDNQAVGPYTVAAIQQLIKDKETLEDRVSKLEKDLRTTISLIKEIRKK